MSVLSRVAGLYDAANYAYGCNGGPSPFRVGSTTAAGAVTISTQPQAFSLVDGTVAAVPFGIYAPITVGIGSTQETVTPSAVAFVPSPSGTVGGGYWNITATFANAHSQGEPISSGTFGLQEAAMDALNNGGGLVVIDGAWSKLGGVTATVTGNKSVGASTTVLDYRGTAGAVSYAAAAGSLYVSTTHVLY